MKGSVVVAEARITGKLAELKRSTFRSRFRLREPDIRYIEQAGMKKVRSDARDLMIKRLKPEHPKNDGKQTPYRGHPVFIAQHATGTCCRGCLKKWHDIEENRELTEQQVKYVVDVIMAWITEQTEMNT